MDYESVIKQMIADGAISQDTVEKYCPELKESEDERMRKSIKVLILNMKDRGKVYDTTKEDMLAWLEKKGGQKSIVNIKTWKYIVDEVLTKFNGIGQYLDNPQTTAIAEELQRKYSLEQKPVWSEEDEKIIETISGCVLYDGSKMDDEKLPLIDWLKSLKPQPKQEWSEEDDTTLSNLIWAIKEDMVLADDRDKYVNWLKFIKERYSWKPSKKQMYILNWVANILLNQNSLVDQSAAKELNSLYQDLQKLKD